MDAADTRSTGVMGDPVMSSSRPTPVPARSRWKLTLVVLVLSVLAIGGSAGAPWPYAAVTFGAIGLIIVVAPRVTHMWRWLLLLVVLVMLFPIRVYGATFPTPIAPELYRGPLFMLILGVLGGLVFARRGTYQPLTFGWAPGIFLLSVIASIAFNAARIAEEQAAGRVIGGLANLLVLISVVFITRQLLTSADRVMTLLMLLVACGVIVAFFALFERVTHENMFWKFDKFLPLEFLDRDIQRGRGGGARAYGSAQHPIALAMLFSCLVPIAIYLMKHAPRPVHPTTRTLVFGLATVMMLAGIATTVSRTAVVALGAAWLIVLVLRPLLALMLAVASFPLLVLGYLLQPKIVESTVLSFFDLQGLIGSQYSGIGTRGAGRLADVAPVMQEFANHPWFGVGLGYRITIGDERNSFILDNQYFGSLLDGGVFGVLGLIVLMVTPVLALAGLAWRSGIDARHRDLALALAASTGAMAVGSYFYDAFNFAQATMVYFMLVACGGWLLTVTRENPSRTGRSQKDRSRSRTTPSG